MHLVNSFQKCAIKINKLLNCYFYANIFGSKCRNDKNDSLLTFKCFSEQECLLPRDACAFSPS